MARVLLRLFLLGRPSLQPKLKKSTKIRESCKKVTKRLLKKLTITSTEKNQMNEDFEFDSVENLVSLNPEERRNPTAIENEASLDTIVFSIFMMRCVA